MKNIREWASQTTEEQRKNFSRPLTDELLELINSELQLDTPDYEGCVMALTTLPHRSVDVFYEKLYPSLPEYAKRLINDALLKYSRNAQIKQAACPRMAQAIQGRLKNEESVESLVPELQWYVENATESILQKNFKKIWCNCDAENCSRLFELDLMNWPVGKTKLQAFYSYLYQMLQKADGKTDWNSIYENFLEKNHWNDLENNSKDLEPLPPASQSVSSSKNAPESRASEYKSKDISKVTTLKQTSTTSSISIDNQSAIFKKNEDPATKISALTSEADPLKIEDDGVKLAELLLTWTKMQTQGTNVLKSTLKSLTGDLKQRDEHIANLSKELIASKKEVKTQKAVIEALQQELTAMKIKLAAERETSAELDKTIGKLQQMNENSAAQAVLGYKANLASSLKSIVEDARLPESQQDIEILSALFSDLMDTLRFKGIPLEDK